MGNIANILENKGKIRIESPIKNEDMSVKPETVEQRLEILEAEVALLKSQLNNANPTTQPWWKKITGTFANNPAYDEAMQLGHKYRESLRSHSESSEESEDI